MRRALYFKKVSHEAHPISAFLLFTPLGKKARKFFNSRETCLRQSEMQPEPTTSVAKQWTHYRFLTRLVNGMLSRTDAPRSGVHARLTWKSVMRRWRVTGETKGDDGKRERGLMH
jgi:hypothetical protein